MCCFISWCKFRKRSSYFYPRLRELLILELAYQKEDVFGSKIEVDESYFGGKRKGKQGCGAKAYAKVIPDVSSPTLMPIIEWESYSFRPFLGLLFKNFY